jgi:hypothetical protein
VARTSLTDMKIPQKHDYMTRIFLACHSLLVKAHDHMKLFADTSAHGFFYTSSNNQIEDMIRCERNIIPS